jgi:hypothetical protein
MAHQSSLADHDLVVPAYRSSGEIQDLGLCLYLCSNFIHSRVISNTIKWKESLNIHYVHAPKPSISTTNTGTTETSTTTKESIKDPLLLLPGFGVGTFHYDRNIEKLSTDGDMDVYSLDLLGQGIRLYTIHLITIIYFEI